MTARQVAVRLLTTVRREGSYSNILLENMLSATDLSETDRSFVTRLVYGVLERQITLDWCLSSCTERPLKKLHPLVAEVLRVSAYQLLYMERVPDSAVVNEAVKLVKKSQPYAAGLVNGVLRALLRKKDMLFNDLPAGDEGLAVRYSCPQPLVTFWREAYGEELLHGLLQSVNEAAPTYIRINTLETDMPTFLQHLDAANLAYRSQNAVPDCVEVFSAVGLKRLEKSVQNWYYHQDMASQYCCHALGAKPGERIADVCAAPGGKTLTVAQLMQNRGEILAGDIYPAKCEVLKNRAQQMGATIVRTLCRDAATSPPPALCGTFDRVICDAPCSGLGVIRRKPEIRYKSLQDFEKLPELQLAILSEAAKLVKPGGALQYSTCTLNPAENRVVAEQFLKEHPEFTTRTLFGLPESVLDEPSWCRTLFPSIHHTDGFFIAGFERIHD